MTFTSMSRATCTDRTIHGSVWTTRGRDQCPATRRPASQRACRAFRVLAGQRLRSALREPFPAVLDTFPDLLVSEELELLKRAPNPARAFRASRSKITAGLARACRRHPRARTEQIRVVVRTPALRRPPEVEAPTN